MIGTPTLVVDIGGTLLTRSRPGATARAWSVVEPLLNDPTDVVQRVDVGRAVLTAHTREEAAAAIAAAFDLIPRYHAAVLEALRLPEGEAIVHPSAVHTLEVARRLGWRIVAATNAAGWVQDLPSQLSRSIEEVVSSSAVGWTKRDPEFWHHLICSRNIDPNYCLVVGNESVVDAEVPRRAGLLALCIADTLGRLEVLADGMEQAGSAPEDCIGIVAGRPFEWADLQVIEVPHLTRMVEHVTRYPVLAVTAMDPPLRAWILRRRIGPPVYAGRDGGGPPLLAWLVAAKDRRKRRPPPDLAAALTSANLSLDHLSVRDRRHLVSFVHEAHDQQTRRARIDSIVALLSGRDADQ
ncbi:MAG: hypothetical protein P0119_22340 [Nitrospira sp.]|nr:hypothetical protein [Nitrospira sp.]